VKQNWKGLGTYGTVGLELALSILFGLLVGNWADKKLGTHGWLALIGFFFGLAAGARSLYRVVQQSKRQLEREDRAERQARKDYDARRPPPEIRRPKHEDDDDED
jgi:F0F1-type ATP synthase assembly protein I